MDRHTVIRQLRFIALTLAVWALVIGALVITNWLFLAYFIVGVTLAVIYRKTSSFDPINYIAMGVMWGLAVTLLAVFGGMKRYDAYTLGDMMRL